MPRTIEQVEVELAALRIMGKASTKFVHTTIVESIRACYFRDLTRLEAELAELKESDAKNN